MNGATKINCGGVTTFKIAIAGQSISDDTPVKSIVIEKGINRISGATITVLDGNAAESTFKISSSDIFLPGKEISIELGKDSNNTLAFKGIITQQSVQINDTAGSSLLVECRDEAIKMIVGRKSKTFSKKTDSEIISSIIETYEGLKSTVSTTSTVWPEQVQHYTTDWDFIVSRAEANGLVVSTDNGTISIIKPDEASNSGLTISYGQNLMELKADLNAVSQLKAVKAGSWDYKTQEIIYGEAANTHPGAGNLASEELSKVIGLSDFQLQTAASVSKEDLTSWSQAQMTKSEYSKIRGEIKIQGTNKLNPGNLIKLQGVGNRF